MIKCVAIDDEPKAIEIIKNHVSKIEYLQLEHCVYRCFKSYKIFAGKWNRTPLSRH